MLSESEIVKTYKIKFPDHNPMSEWEFIIPMKYLYSANFGHNNILSLNSYKDKLEFMDQISKAQKVSCSVRFCSEFKYLTECITLFPQKCCYSIAEYSNRNNWVKLKEYIKEKLEEYIKEKLEEDWFDHFFDLKIEHIDINQYWEIKTKY